MAIQDDHQDLVLIDPSPVPSHSLLLPHQPSDISYPLAKQEDEDFSLIPDDQQSQPSSNFRSKKRNRVMQSCVACHSQKRKCDRKRPCTRCTEHGIAGQCVYQLEDPAVRDGPEQDELLRLRSRVRELERTVQVLMQKPLSRRAAAALEAETDAILGTTSTRKRKVDRDRDSDGRASKIARTHTHSLNTEALPEWAAMPDPSFPSPIDSPFSPFAPTPSESHFPHHPYLHYNDFTPPGDVPTPPYSTFPTPSSDAGSPFKIPDPPRRFSDGATLANMLSHTTMAATPESLAAGSPLTPASITGVSSFTPITGPATQSTEQCGCGTNPMGNEVYNGLQAQLEAAYGVLSPLPDHHHGPCDTIMAIANLIESINVATRTNSTPAVSAPPIQQQQQQPPPGPQPMTINGPPLGPPPPPPSTTSYIANTPSSHMTPASTSHMSPASHMSPSEPGPSPHSSIATPPNYGLYTALSSHTQPYYHSDVPTVVGFNSLSSWAAYGGSTSFLNSSSSSLANFDGHKDQNHHHGVHHHHHHHHPGAADIVVYDHAQP